MRLGEGCVGGLSMVGCRASKSGLLVFIECEWIGVMKNDLHPEFREVVFKDVSSDFTLKTKSTIATKETTTWDDGQEYPLVKVDISSASHPFYTGKQRLVDTEGRAEKFLKKYGRRRKS